MSCSPDTTSHAAICRGHLDSGRGGDEDHRKDPSRAGSDGGVQPSARNAPVASSSKLRMSE